MRQLAHSCRPASSCSAEEPAAAGEVFHPFQTRRAKVVGDAITLVAVISWIFCACIW